METLLGRKRERRQKGRVTKLFCFHLIHTLIKIKGHCQEFFNKGNSPVIMCPMDGSLSLKHSPVNMDVSFVLRCVWGGKTVSWETHLSVDICMGGGTASER